MMDATLTATLFEQAQRALTRETFPVAAGWNTRSSDKSPYKGATFRVGPDKWVVCTGRQQAERARLLDASAWLITKEAAAGGVAILEAGEVDARPTSDYKNRFRSAAWDALRLLWVDGAADAKSFDFSHSWSRSASVRVEEAVRSALLSRNDWSECETSADVELRARAVLNAVLHGFGYREQPVSARKFDSFWRRGVADGLWASDSGTLALEAKLDEDVDAPFGQILDDLGAFDAVVSIRLVRNENVRRKLAASTLRTAREHVARLPVAFIALGLCAVCKAAVTELDYPNVVCASCDSRAVNSDGGPAEAQPEYDQGDNPVFIDQVQCWRRYRFGGWIAMSDPRKSKSLEEFYEYTRRSSDE